MSAGLPGLGLGGLFFILLGLAAPFVEAGRTILGRSTAARWRVALRQFVMSLSILVALERSYWLVSELFGFGRSSGTSGPLGVGEALPVTPVVLTLLVLIVVLLATTLMRRVVELSAPAVTTTTITLAAPPTSVVVPVPRPAYWSECSPEPRTLLPAPAGAGADVHHELDLREGHHTAPGIDEVESPGRHSGEEPELVRAGR
jgi:hypothetical protein